MTAITLAGVNLQALDVLVEILAQAEAGVTPDEFYGRLCEAVCRLVGMDRAVIFRYDPTLRRVRASGAHGIDLEPFRNVRCTPTSESIMTSLERERRGPLRVSMVRERLVEYFAEHFGFERTSLFFDHPTLRRKATTDAVASHP